jgi:hypothetical protein
MADRFGPLSESQFTHHISAKNGYLPAISTIFVSSSLASRQAASAR